MKPVLLRLGPFRVRIVITCLAMISMAACTNSHDRLYPVVVDGMTGYIDKDGSMRIEPRAGVVFVDRPEDRIPFYSDDGGFGFLDRNGDVAVRPAYASGDPFSHGIAMVRLQSGGYVCIGTNGQLVHSRVLDAASHYVGELSPLRTGGKWGFIDRFGHTVVEPQYDEWQSPSEGLMAVKSGERWGFIGFGGQTIVEARYEDVGRFVDGLAAARTGQLWGFIDRHGNWAVSPAYTEVAAFSEELAAVQVRDGKWGFIDRHGNTAIEPRFESVQSFSEGLAGVKVRGKWGFIDKQNGIVVEPEFDEVQPFSEGRAVVGKGGRKTQFTNMSVVMGRRYGYIDSEGRIAVAIQFDAAGPFEGGLAAVRVNVCVGPTEITSDLGYIDRSGQWVWKP